METLKTSVFSFIIVNLVNKGILHFLITNGLPLQIVLQKNLLIDFLEEHFKQNLENAKCINFQFHNLKFSQEGILDIHVSTTAEMCMKEVIDSCPRRAL